VKSLLFSEEKRSKKDFVHWRSFQGEQRGDESFLVLFFKKEHASFLDRDRTP
jgi:hypothetical protein